MGNHLLNCFQPKIEEFEILKSSKNEELKNSLNDFILSLKPVNKASNHKILKLKFEKTLMIDNKTIYNMSSFPCGNFILITDEGIIYIYDNKFNLLKKHETNKYKELCIKDNTNFITYGESKINLWEFIQKRNILNSIYLIDTKLSIGKVSIIDNGDIIGITESNLSYRGPFHCFIYEKTKNNIYQKKSFIKYKSYILSFLISKKNSELIILYYNEVNYEHYTIDIYDYRKLKLKKKIEEKIYNLNSYINNFLFNINQNIFAFIHTNKRPTRATFARDIIILYDINNGNKIIFLTNIFLRGKLEYFSSINAFINFHCVFGLQVNFIYILSKERKCNTLHRLDIDDKLGFSNYFKLNENELCIYSEEYSVIKIFELIE